MNGISELSFFIQKQLFFYLDFMTYIESLSLCGYDFFRPRRSIGISTDDDIHNTQNIKEVDCCVTVVIGPPQSTSVESA